MGLFWHTKKDSADHHEKGMQLYKQGKYRQAIDQFLKSSNEKSKYYWIGICHWETYVQTGQNANLKQCEQFLTMAAEAGHPQAAQLLAQKFHNTKYLSNMPETASAKPAPKSVTAEAAPESAPKPASAKATPESAPKTTSAESAPESTPKTTTAKATPKPATTANASASAKAAPKPQTPKDSTEDPFNSIIQAALDAGKNKDYDKKRALLRDAAEHNNPAAQYHLSMMYYQGEGRIRDMDEALLWANKAKTAGYEKADEAIALIRDRLALYDKIIEGSERPQVLWSMEQYKLGMDMYHKANYRKAVELLTLACPTGITNPDRYYDGYAALAWMLENGKGTDDDHPSRLAQPLYKILAQHGDKNAMESYVRMTLKDEEPEVEPCQLSLDYIKKLNQKKLNQKVPELEKKLATAQAEDEKREKFWEEHAGQNIFELLEDLNQG